MYFPLFVHNSSEYLVPSAEYLVPSSEYLVPSSEYLVPSAGYLVPGGQFNTASISLALGSRSEAGYERMKSLSAI